MRALVLLLALSSAGCGGRSDLPEAGGAATIPPGATCPAPCAGPACCLLSQDHSAAGGNLQSQSIDADPVTGDIAVAGWYTGAPDLGTGPLPDAEGIAGGLFVARYDREGHPRWAKGFPGGGPGWLGFSGPDLFVASGFGGDVDFGCGTLHGPPENFTLPSVPVAMKLDGSTGSCLWSRALATGSGSWIGGAVDAAGDLVTLGDIGASPVPVPLGCEGAPVVQGTGYVMKQRGSDGTCLWLRVLASSPNLFWGNGVAVDASGAVYVATALDTPQSFAGETLTPASVPGQFAALLLKYDGDGNELWGRTWGNHVGTSAASTVLVTPDQRVWIAGNDYNAITLGGETFGPDMGQDAFVAGLTPDGALFAATPVTGSLPSTMLLTADPTGALVVAATFGGDLAIGGKTVASGTAQGLFVAKLDPAASLAPRWTRLYGQGAQEISAWGIRAAGCDILLTGGFSGTLDFGCAPSVSGSPDDLFFALLGP